MGVSCYPKLRKITKHTLFGVLEPSKYTLTNNILNSDHIMNFNNLRVQLNYLQVFRQVPSFKCIKKPLYLPMSSFSLTIINYFFHKVHKTTNEIRNLAKNILMRTSDIWHMLFSQVPKYQYISHLFV